MKSIGVMVMIALALACCTNSTKPGKAESVKMVEAFFDVYKAKGPRQAIVSLMQTNAMVTKEVTDTLGIRLERYMDGLGKFQGHEQVAEASYGEGILHLAYVVKYTRQPVRFNFMFYNSGDGWRIQHFRYEAIFPEELDESVKAYRLKENQ
jgi:hypothetical protein